MIILKINEPSIVEPNKTHNYILDGRNDLKIRNN